MDASAIEHGLSLDVLGGGATGGATGGAGRVSGVGSGSGAGMKIVCDAATIKSLRERYGERVMEGSAHWKWVLKQHGCL